MSIGFVPEAATLCDCRRDPACQRCGGKGWYLEPAAVAYYENVRRHSDFLLGFADWLEQLVPQDRWETVRVVADVPVFEVRNARGTVVRVRCELAENER